MAKSKYRLNPRITTSLLDENIEAIEFFCDLMLKPHNAEILDTNTHMRYDVIKLERWKNDLKEFKKEDMDDEVVQLVVTLKHILGTYIGWYYHKDGELHDNKELAHFYHERITNDPEFNKDFDIAYLKLYTLDRHMIRLYHYLKENPDDRKGIESLDAIIEEERVDILQRFKAKIERNEEINDDMVKALALCVGYDDGIELIHKVHSGAYLPQDIADIIGSRLDKKMGIKR